MANSRQCTVAYKDHNDVQFLIGKRNCLLLAHESFLYKRINGLVPKTTWKCISFKSGCPVTGTTYDGILKKISGTHTHLAPVDEIKVIKAEMKVKERVQTEFNLTPRQIHMQERTKLLLQNDNSAHFLMESFSKRRGSLYRYRREKFPPAPLDRHDIMLENEWRLTLDRSESFLMIDHHDSTTDRILVFGTNSNLRILCNADYVISDGTFKVHPNLFAQLYVFHAPYLGKVVPLLFCLLPNKTTGTYEKLLSLIKEASSSIGCHFLPKTAIVDYEQAMISAITSVLPHTAIQGCQFHYSQCIWRKVQALGLKMAYQNNVDVRRWIRRFSALPFLPIQEVENGYLEISENAPNPSDGVISRFQIESFHNYIVETWVDEISGKFDKGLWNQYNNNGPRTTNHAEGWNNKLNQDAKTRLSFYQFVHFLQCLQVDLDATKFDLISESPTTQKLRYKNVNDAITIAKKNYATGSIPILNYLDSISYAMKLE